MADSNSAVHIGENSPEQVAYKLMERIAHAEGKPLYSGTASYDRNWVLTTYAECLRTVKDPYSYPAQR